MADFGYTFGPDAFGKPFKLSSTLPAIAQSSSRFFPFPNPLEPSPTSSTRSRTRTSTRGHFRQHKTTAISKTSSTVAASDSALQNGQNTLSQRPAETTETANGVAAGSAAADQASQSSPHRSSTGGGGGVSGGVIAAAVVVPILVLAALGAVIFFLLRRRRRQKAAEDMTVQRSPPGAPMEIQQVESNAPRLPPLAISRKPVPYSTEPNYAYAGGQSTDGTNRSIQPELHMVDNASPSRPPQINMVNGHYVSSNVSERDPFDDPETPASRLTEPFATRNQSAASHAMLSQQTSAAALRPASPLHKDPGAKDVDEVSEVSDLSDNEDVGPEETAVVSTAQRASVIQLNGTHSAHSSRGSNASHHSQQGSPTTTQQPSLSR